MRALCHLDIDGIRGRAMNGLINRMEALVGRRDNVPDVFREGDALIIDCRGCGIAPVPGSDECVRCMVDSMCEHGGAERIVLRTGMDMEVSGRAGRAIREAASVRRWSYTRERQGARCRACPVSRRAVMDAAWAAFPEGTVREGRRTLETGSPGREGCDDCVMRTSAAMDQVESGLARIVADMSSAARVVR